MDSAVTAWARCRPYLEAAIRRSDSPPLEEVERRIEQGRAWFWAGREAAAIYEFTKDANCWLAGGSLAEILARHDDVEDWARAHACDRLTLRGRPGWGRVLAPLGYRPITCLVKELT